MSKYLNPMKKQLFQLSIYDFHSVKTSLAKHVSLMSIGYKSIIKANSRSFLDTMEVSVYFDQKQISLSDIAGTG